MKIFGIKNRIKSGFTMVEMLAVVVVIALLATFAIEGIVVAGRNIRQAALDKDAQIIYNAVQNRMTELRASGRTSVFQPDEDNGIELLSYTPSDNVNFQKDISLCYLQSVSQSPITADANTVNTILPVGCVDEDLRNGYWYIEYSSESGSIYSVFYSDKELIPTDSESLNSLRLKANRLSGGSVYGYYGGDAVGLESIERLQPVLTIENGEQLIAHVECVSFVRPDFTFTVSDGVNEYTKEAPSNEIISNTAAIWEYTWVMDSLDSVTVRFANQCTNVVPGASIKVTVVASSNDTSLISGSDSKNTNGIFADSTTMDTAYIECGRHLQNLDISSGVTDSITKAEIKNDIDFDATDGWNTVYNNMYFKPITNSGIVSVNSELNNSSNKARQIKNIRINETGYAGLFAEFNGSEISKIYMVDADVIGNAGVGTFAGKTTANLSINDCKVYYSRSGSLISYLRTDSKDKVYNTATVLGGVNTGAFIGSSTGNVSITNSCAAIVINSNGNAGGFIGNANAGLSVSGSYTDCYIKGTNAGGICGTGSISISKSYTAGFSDASTASAGFTCGNAEINNCYTAVSHDGSGVVYSTASTGSVSGTVYFVESGADLANTVKISFDDLHNADLSSLGFTSGVKTNAYNLVDGMALQAYPFAGISGMRHYGDWDDSFITGNLVYFEKYSDGSYGFFGSGIDCLKNLVVVRDGYAIVYDKSDKVPENVEIEYNGKKYTATEKVTAKNDEDNYSLVLIDSSIYVYSEQFYQKIKVLDSDYYINPFFAKSILTEASEPENGELISIRSARQFNSLSKYYNSCYTKYSQLISSFVFNQEENIDFALYEWSTCSDKVITYQEPISDKEHSFSGRYKGNCHYISNVSVMNTGTSEYVGVFGYVTGVIQDLYIVSESTASTYITSGTGTLTTLQSSKSLYMGSMAGYNSGVINNCAVAGYSMDILTKGRSFVGGLVGLNAGVISNCSSETKLIKVETNYAPETYVASFVGYNTSNISSCYSIGRIDIIKSDTGVTIASGFASVNSATISDCYAATVIQSSGGADAFGFAPKGGTFKNCYFLNKGIFSFINDVYTYENTNANNAGSAITNDELKSLATKNKLVCAESRFCSNTDENAYLFPGYVTVNGTRTHFGDWPEVAQLGTAGIFYWEVESGGSNAGVHISYQDSEGKYIGSTLCTAHDDGGVITSYGYGFFYKSGSKNLSFKYQNIENSIVIRSDISDEIEKYLPGYEYISYESATPLDSKAGMYVSGKSVNAKWIITTSAGSRQFTFNPFFADSISKYIDGKEVVPGSAKNPYKIRSVNQLQFINWNSSYKNGVKSITSSSDTANNAYTYLKYAAGSNGDTSKVNYYWQQSHDVNANGSLFSPIGSLYDADTSNTDNSNVYMAYFAGDYDGNEYSISNVEIYSNNQCVGLFGVTAGAKLHDIVLYSNQGNSITEGSAGTNWYCLGGLVGFAAEGTGSNSKLTNCTVSGYTIKDLRGSSDGGYGGANIGGLVGATNMDITNCTAVTDIVVDFKYNSSHKNIRVGGLVGSVRATISNSYVGGSIYVPDKNVDLGNFIENIFTDYYDRNASIWIGGISGGVYLRNSGNLSTLVGPIDQMTKIINCYSYTELPETNFKKNLVRAVQSIAANGELQSREFEVNTNSRANEILNPKIEIYNCYVLLANSSKTDDAVLYSESYRNSAMWEVDMRSERMKKEKISSNNDNTDRGIWIFNSYSPYLTYSQMSDLVSANGLLSKLSQGPIKSTFGSVTVEENGLNVSGKYSYPGNDYSLYGKNYPFPTILTRSSENGTVNVHYGAWPKAGIFTDVSNLSIDLISDYNSETNEAKEVVNLELVGTVAGSALNVEVGNEAYATVSVEKINEENYRLTVYGHEVGSTIVKVSYVSDGVTYSTEITVNVTAKVNVSSILSDVSIGKSVIETLTATDSKGNALNVDWKFEAVDVASDQLFTFNSDNAKNVSEDTVTINGLAKGEGQIKAICTVEVGGKNYTGIGFVSVTVWRVDCFGLVDLTMNSSVYNEAVVTENDTVFSGTNRTYVTDAPTYNKGTIYLYCTGLNIDLDKWNVSSVSIDGIDYLNHTPDKFFIELGDKDITLKEYSYLPISIMSSELSINKSVVVTVTDGAKTVSLTVPFKTQSTATKVAVSFKANNGTGTMPAQTFTYGQTQNLATNTFTRQYYVFTSWNTQANGKGTKYNDQQAITYLPKDTTLYAQWMKKPCNMIVDEAYPGGAYDSTYVDAGTSYTLPSPVRKGYDFLGWLCDGKTYAAGSVVVPEDDMTFTAQWQIIQYKITFNHGEGGSGDDYTQEFTIENSGERLYSNRFTNSNYYWRRFDHWEPSDRNKEDSFVDQELLSIIIDYMWGRGIRDMMLRANWKSGM